ncbi:hypothetical protein VL809_11775 [Flavobacterium psychrophilum]|nr:hypothetical protein [Flavobacterium psychrophilum]AIJ37789.1 hypothetical protein FPSM_01294 [Flavobacterium psychrophilum]MEB3387894.1 hypothetical protein [Flavobacterium psychrophilum]MEB3392694.1 hypothetical protein [Flavobacterium psychrophilum]MEB3399928.1 hypothetical protein [Flavobacterium psychrophilum]MEB3402323.1 hypothetical protein [Flavobacterium psychrophilum]
MKAIHNNVSIVNTLPTVGNYKLKYNFESNSQHGINGNEQLISW